MIKLFIKVLPRNLKSGIGKYLVLFLFMTLSIGFISGFLVAGGSMIYTFDQSFEKYNIEDGNFELKNEITPELKHDIKANDVILYENFYNEQSSIHNSTIRIFKDRDKVNIVCVMDGEKPNADNEIAIDQLYAKNNSIQIGDEIKVGSQNFKVTGFVALPDYNSLFENNSDMIFDAIKFGVGIVTDDIFSKLEQTELHYTYSWEYTKKISSEKEKRKKSDELVKTISQKEQLINYIPEVDNKAIHFTGDDMGSDQSTMITMLCLIVVILEFIYAVIISNTIEREASVIGTLRASGYKKKEMICYYLALPVTVTLLAAIVGNILGYTVFKYMVVDMYYNSYSLSIYKTRWNGYAFVVTTIIPIIIMLIINLSILIHRLSLSPLKFLRHEFKKKYYKPLKLPNFKFFTRFRIRVILQNKSGYIILVIGILFANILLLFGTMMTPMFDNYKAKVKEGMISKYQYVLKSEHETSSEKAEKFCIAEMQINKEETVQIYGLQPNSSYVKGLELDHDEVYISDGYAEKYDVASGDTIKIQDKYDKKEYEYKVTGTYDYPSAISVFMSQDNFNEKFDNEENYFNGYFTNETLTDIDDNYIATVISEEDMTKLCRQMDSSMGKMFNMIGVFALILYMLIIYLLSKIVIEKNAANISMVKIMGYKDDEIFKLYMVSTMIVAVFGIAISIPLSVKPLKGLFHAMINKFNGWIPFYITSATYIKMVCIAFVVYLVLSFIQYKKIKKIPLNIILKDE